MVRKGSTVRFRKGAPGRAHAGPPQWRSSSVGESTRLIIVGSRVRIPPPLPVASQIVSPHARVRSSNGQGEVRADEAAFEHWDDWSYRPWEDDVDGCDHEGARGAEFEESFHGVRSDRQGAGGEGAGDHDLDRACGV